MLVPGSTYRKFLLPGKNVPQLVLLVLTSYCLEHRKHHALSTFINSKDLSESFVHIAFLCTRKLLYMLKITLPVSLMSLIIAYTGYLPNNTDSV